MGELIDLNPKKPLADADIPDFIARDTETAAAVAAHAMAGDPHPIYLTQAEGDALYRSVTGSVGVFTTTATGYSPCLYIQEGSYTTIPAYWNFQMMQDRSIALFYGVTGVTAASQKLSISTNNIFTAAPPSVAYGSISIGGTKNGYAGIHFTGGFNSPVFMQSTGGFLNGMWAVTGAVNGWMWYYNEGSFRVFNSTIQSEGTFIGIEKSPGALPGYPNNRHPTLKTDFSNLYFSAGGVYSAAMNSNGVWQAVSDRERKENFIETDDAEILELLLNIPTYSYNFKGSDTRIRNLGCMAQDFYAAFGLGGDEDIDADDSPILPSKMMSTADVVGVCIAAIKGLAKQVEELKENR